MFAVTKDEADPSRRLVLPVKNNIGPDIGGLAYSIVTAENGAPTLGWEPNPVMVSADEMMNISSRDDEERSSQREAGEWLLAILENGPIDAKPLRKLADECGHNWRTAQRAREKVGVFTKVSGFGKDKKARWLHPDCANSLDTQNAVTNGETASREPAPVLDSFNNDSICDNSESVINGVINGRTRAVTGFVGDELTINDNSDKAKGAVTNDEIEGEEVC